MEVDVESNGSSIEQGDDQLFSMSREALIEEVLNLRKVAREQGSDKDEAELQRCIVRSIGQAIICTDLSGTIVQWNKAATVLYGWEEDEAVGQNILSILPSLNVMFTGRSPETHDKLEKGNIWCKEARVLNKKGKYVNVMVTNTPILDEEGSAIGMIGTSMDLQNFRRKEEENGELEQRIMERTMQLKESNDRLTAEVHGHLMAKKSLQAYTKVLEDSQEKMLEQTHDLAKVVDELSKSHIDAESASKLKSRFLASVSHEIRTPLNGIIGMTNLMLETELTEDQMSLMHTIRTSGDALLAIIDDILDFSKIEAGEMLLQHKNFSFMQCLEDAVDLLAAKAVEKNLELSCYVDKTVPEVSQSDPSRLRQVIVNLVSNAVKFTESGEVLVHATAKPWQAGDSEPPQNPPSPNILPSHVLEVSVKDTGIGIQDRSMDRLFKPFSQVDGSTTRRFGGTGLGLIISRQLAEMLGGTLWVQSDGLNCGSTFYFTVALYPPLNPDTNLPFGRSQSLTQFSASSLLAPPIRNPSCPSKFNAGLGFASMDPHAWLSVSNRNLHSTLRFQMKRGSKVSGLTSLQRRHSCGVAQLRRLLESSNSDSGESPVDKQKLKVKLLDPDWVDDGDEAEVGKHPDVLASENLGQEDEEAVEISVKLSRSEPWPEPLESEIGSKPLAKAYSLPSMCPKLVQESLLLAAGSSPVSEPQPDQQATRQLGTSGAGRKRFLVWEPKGELALSDRRRMRPLPAGITPLVTTSPPSFDNSCQPPTAWPPTPIMTPSITYCASLNNRVVLVMENNSAVRGHLSSYLSDLGMKHVAVEGAAEAISLVAAVQDHSPFDAIIMDHMSMDGVSVARQLYNSPGGRNIPVILLCKYGTINQVSVEGTNVTSVLSKPVRQTHLRRALVSAFTEAKGGRLENSGRTGKGTLQRKEKRGRMDQRRMGLGVDGGFREKMGLELPLRILLVEDNLVNQKVASRMLHQLSYSCDVATNGREALEALEKQQYDLVLMDIQMPVMDGIEATQEIIKRWASNQRPRIVAMTANVLNSDKKLCLDVGMDGFISKPVHIHDLILALERTASMKGPQQMEC